LERRDVDSAAKQARASLAAGARTREYEYEGRRIALVEVPGIFSAGHLPDHQTPAAVSVTATRQSYELVFSEALSTAWKVETTAGAGPAPGVPSVPALTEVELEDLRRSVRATQGVLWAYEALRNPETGTLLLPTPRLVLKLRQGIPPSTLDGLSGVRLLRKLRLTESQYLVELSDPDEHPCEAADRLRSHPALEWIEPDFAQELRQQAVPNDPLFPNQWHLQNTGQGGGLPGADARLPGAWDYQIGNGSAVIAVVDDGVELNHPDLTSRIFVNGAEAIDGLDNDGNGYVDDRWGWDFYFDDYDANPILTGPGSHGTSVAGVAAAAGNNGVGVTGACANCPILPVRIFNGASITSNAMVAEAILYAGSFAWVVNNSWGGGSPSTAITNAIDTVATQGGGGLGTPVVISSGNYATGFINFSLAGFSAGTYYFQWVFQKDSSASAGFDRAWIDNILFPDGSLETFEACAGLPAGWSTSGALPWTAVSDETRSSSTLGGRCSLGSGAIGHSQYSAAGLWKTLSTGGTLVYQLWVSAERNSADGTGPLVPEDWTGDPECYDLSYLNVYDSVGTLIWQGYGLCGTYSNNGPPLQDGVVSYPASLANAIAIGALSDSDRRSDYSQWGPELDFTIHSNGGLQGVTTTDVAGANGYSSTDYTSTFGGTSSAAPLASGVIGLLLSDQPSLTLTEIRERLQRATRKVGTVAYSGGRNNQYGYGAISAELLLTQLFIDDFESGGLTRWSNY